jgi:hypothetical protein
MRVVTKNMLRSKVWLAGTLLLLSSGLGCQSLLRAPGSTASQTPATAIDAPTYTVEVHSNWTNPTTKRQSFTGRVPLQKVVEQTGAHRRNRDLDITVVRVAKESGQILRLTAKFDPQSRSVQPQYDYDILANDHVIIKPSTSSPLDDLIKPMSQLTGG